MRDSSVTGVQNCALPIQAEDGIRDSSVTGVQTCALPIKSEEHTSELQSLLNLVCRLLLEKKKPRVRITATLEYVMPYSHRRKKTNSREHIKDSTSTSTR